MNRDLLILDKFLAGKAMAQARLVLIVTDQKCYPTPERSCESKAFELCFVFTFVFHTRVFKAV